jgi:2-haloalkanoic acid dehalogenase type II
MPAKITDFDALMFNCYGTLIDWERGVLDALRPWMDRHRVEADDEGFMRVLRAAKSREQAQRPAKLFPLVLADTLRAVGKHWGKTVSDEEASRFGASVGQWPAYVDSAPALQYLKRFYKLVILSNVDRASFAESAKQLNVDFDDVITAEDVGAYKPDPRNFQFALERLAARGIPRNRVLHTAQSLVHDFEPAKAAGLAILWINRRKGRRSFGAAPPAATWPVPDFEVGSMADVVRLHQTDLRREAV